MTRSLKAQLYNYLKGAGITFDKHYRDYNTEELQVAVDALDELNAQSGSDQRFVPEEPGEDEPEDVPAARGSGRAREVGAGAYAAKYDEEPLYTDEYGNVWYREEVRKPSTPLPRKRRVLRYVDPGVQTLEVHEGGYTETVEVQGSRTRAAEVKITMPSYQVGIYRAPNLPFRIHVYNEARGFALQEVADFYGGADLVPEGVKRTYVGNDLCYDIQSTIRAIQREYREQQLKGLIQ